MSEQKTKSNAPWILGIVGFGLSIPQVVCSILCATAAAQVAQESSQVSEKAASDAATLGFIFLLPAICTAVCFILSFFGKSKFSAITGVLLILLGLVDAYACYVNWSVLGIAAAICFACAGISSVCNAKK